jgi:hypothetical protein
MLTAHVLFERMTLFSAIAQRSPLADEHLSTKLTGGNGAQRNWRPVERLVSQPPILACESSPIVLFCIVSILEERSHCLVIPDYFNVW